MKNAIKRVYLHQINFKKMEIFTCVARPCLPEIMGTRWNRSNQKKEDANMGQTLHRHEITDGVWALLQPHLPGQKGQWGGIAEDNRRFINAVFWILRTGAPWRDLPPEYGKWGTVYQRFNRWRNKGIWEKLLELLIEEPDYEWLMIDASHIEGHPHAAGAAGGNQDIERTIEGSRYIWPWMRLVCQSEVLLQQVPERIVDMLRQNAARRHADCDPT